MRTPIMTALALAVLLIGAACSEDPDGGADGATAPGTKDASANDQVTGLGDGATSGCQGAADGTPCDDGLPCSANDHCKAGVCKAGDNVCACSADANCALYEDNDLCNGTLYCDLKVFPYRCVLNPATAVTCKGATGPCTTERCEPTTGKCTSVAVTDGTVCLDDSPCTVDSSCQSGACVGGQASWCACEADADCNQGGDDTNLCDGSLYCDKSAFPHTCKVVASTVVLCATGSDSACTKNACQPATGQCAAAAVETLAHVCDAAGVCRWRTPAKGTPPTSVSCDDGNACSQNETCAAGQCVGGLDVCICAKDADCDAQEDGDLCNGTLYCDVATGGCKVNPKTPVTCASAADTTCTQNTCNPLTGTCALTPVKPGKVCDDGDPCTTGEICKGGVCTAGVVLCQCKTDVDCVAKDDGDLCNGTLFCNTATGKCLPNPASAVTCPSVGDTDCLKNTCVPQTGKCSFETVKSGEKCDDGDACTVGDWCLSGACKSGANTCECQQHADCAGKDDGDLCNGVWFCDTSGKAPACKPNPGSIVWCAKDNDGACVKNLCDSKTGKCGLQPAIDGASCPATGPCVSKAVCAAGSCTVAVKSDCDDANPCTVDKCDAKLGCQHNNVPCEDGNACTLDTCDAKTGKCASNAAPMQGKSCDADGDGCTVNDFCKAGKCVGGGQVLCPKATNPCAQAQCVSVTAQSHTCVVVPSQEGSACAGDHPCLLGSTCKAGSCVPGQTEKLFRHTRALTGQLVSYADVTAHPNGGYVAVGSVRAASGAGGASWLVDRFDAAGALMAGQGASGKPLLVTSPVADVGAGAVGVHATADGVVVLGTVRTTKDGRQVRMLALAADTQTVVWDRVHGGGQDEVALALAPLDGGGWLAAGQIGSAAASDGLALRLSATGLLLATWTQPETGAQALLDGVGTSDGGALLVGWRTPPSGKQQAWVLRLDGGWKTVWSHPIGDAAAQALTTVQRVGTTTIAAGWQGAPVPHAWWLDLDALGKIRSQHTTTLPSAALSIAPLGGGSFALGGRMVAAVSSGWMAGVDGSGHLFWQREVSEGGDEHVTRLAATVDGGLVTVGAVGTTGKSSGVLARTDAWGRATCAASGACAAKNLPACGDGNVCTDDLCDAKQGCAPAHNAIGCDDGDACTTADACQSGSCLGGGKTACDDANTCTTDACDTKKGCVHSPAIGATCADGSVCTSDEKCVTGVCQMTVKNCDDGEVCTVDACDAIKGCLHQAKADETPCGSGKVCLLGTCSKRWATAIVAGDGITIAISPSGEVRSWGYAAYGTLGRSGVAHLPGLVPNLPPSVRVSSGGLLSCAGTVAGQVYCWGAGPHGIGCSVPYQMAPVPIVNFTDTAIGLTTGVGSRVCAAAKSGLTRCWGDNAWGGCGIGVAGAPVCTPGKAVLDLSDTVQISAGDKHTCARAAGGKVRCWGTSPSGELGDGGAFGYANKTSTPRDVKGLVDAIDLSASGNHACAVRAGGTVVCWGNNESGQLGDGSLTNRNAPTPAFGLSDAIAVDAGGDHTCALRKTGQVVCWGNNSYGQLGTGTTYKSIAPLPVPALDAVVAISAGKHHTCAVRKNGEVRCWGLNGYGELGSGKTGGQSLSPVTVVGSKP